jgi:hypothetical protein
MSVDTVCIDDDAGCAEEGAGLTPQEKADCKVEMLDIFSIDKDQYRAEEDPTKVVFARAASRGPLVKASEHLVLSAGESTHSRFRRGGLDPVKR